MDGSHPETGKIAVRLVNFPAFVRSFLDIHINTKYFSSLLISDSLLP